MNDRIDQRLAAPTTLAIGTPVEGGFFAGYLTMPDGVYGIAVAPKAGGELRGKWLSDWRKDVPGALSCFDCRANTLAMAEAGSELAQRILGLDINGCTDWSLPSRDVLELLHRSFKPTTQANSCSFRDGDNPSSLPVGYPYTNDAPAQTIAEAFREGGSEAFEADYYWSSTQYSPVFAWFQSFAYGYQDYCDKLHEFLARAVRRLPI